MAAIRLEVTCRFPLQVKLIDVLRVFCLDQLSNELELLAESKDSLLEDRHFPWCPFLEDTDRSNWVYENVEISLLVEMVDGVKVEFDGFLLFLGVGLVYLVLRLDHLKDGVLLETKVFDELDVGMIIAVETGFLDAMVESLEVRLGLLVALLLFLGFRHIVCL